MKFKIKNYKILLTDTDITIIDEPLKTLKLRNILTKKGYYPWVLSKDRRLRKVEINNIVSEIHNIINNNNI